LGVLWLATECYRFRLLAGGVGAGARIASKPESKDVVGCVWLSMSRTLGRGNNVAGALQGWVQKAGKEHKVPMAFVYGKTNPADSNHALSFVKMIKPGYVRDAKAPERDDLRATGDWGVPNSKLVGSKLLGSSLPTAKWISTDYLEKAVLERSS